MHKIKHTYRPRRFIGWAVVIAVAAVFLSGVLLQNTSAYNTENTRIQAPEFTQQDERDWFNSAPLQIENLRGKVVMIDFWTFGCWNCYRSFPWLKGVEEKFAGQPFTVIGVHSPEFEHEKNYRSIEKKIAEFGLEHPVMVDNDHKYWKKVRNRYWPAFYIIDKDGYIRSIFIGETHAGQPQAKKIEKRIAELLKESA